MSEFDNPWTKPLWKRNAEDNMSLRHEIEKNYDAFSNPWREEVFGHNNTKQSDDLMPQSETSLFGTYTQNSKPQAFAQMAESSEISNNAPSKEYDFSNSNDPNCYMEFDGKNVDLYKYGQHNGNRLQNGLLKNNLSGQSGDDYHQGSIYQNVANKGPIPEGTYYANQNQRQNITARDAILGGITKVFDLPYGAWKGSLPAWGTKRVWLQPDVNTNTYGRDGFSIHGGLTKGSAGCIDIPWQTGKLSDYLDDCQDSVPLYVKYPKGW